MLFGFASKKGTFLPQGTANPFDKGLSPPQEVEKGPFIGMYLLVKFEEKDYELPFKLDFLGLCYSIYTLKFI